MGHCQRNVDRLCQKGRKLVMDPLPCKRCNLFNIIKSGLVIGPVTEKRGHGKSYNQDDTDQQVCFD